MRARARIGTSGWVYPHWRGRFYPKALPTSEWLAFYAQPSSTTPSTASSPTSRAWARCADDRVVVRHRRRARRAAIPVQLPPRFAFDPGRCAGLRPARRRAAAGAVRRVSRVGWHFFCLCPAHGMGTRRDRPPPGYALPVVSARPRRRPHASGRVVRAPLRRGRGLPQLQVRVPGDPRRAHPSSRSSSAARCGGRPTRARASRRTRLAGERALRCLARLRSSSQMARRSWSASGDARSAGMREADPVR